MKMKCFSSVYYTSIFVVLLSCGEDDVDCSAVLPPPNWFEIGFFDTQGNALIGSVYQQEEFRLYNDNTELLLRPVPFGDPERLQVIFSNIQSNIEYYIELTATDTDTLHFNYETINGPCFSFSNLTEVIFNGRTIEFEDDSRIDLIK
ncbi:MAG: hypothetical protein HKN00_08865 [Flavobacteriaceae bacterium]|nr:hypothetical protein [Bacteroidia bacterium]NNF75280.1 hypothetical protein [Flavobacteriaceae bacterium]NNK72113.1 hypothetical protein [Flavobacteriaceae bacterium]